MAINVLSKSDTEALIQTIADKISVAVDPEEILIFPRDTALRCHASTGAPASRGWVGR
jgi:hypothetical protein